MSEIGDTYKAIKEEKREKKRRNAKNSISLLNQSGLPYESFGGFNLHLRVDDRYDFWPTTGKFYDHKTKRWGRGVKNLLKKARSENEN